MQDENNIKEVIDEFYDIISGTSTEERDWSRFKDLFFENAILMSSRFNENHQCISIPLNVETYIIGLDKFLKTKDFYENGLNYKIHIYNHIAQVYSEYEARAALNDTVPMRTGVNLVQLINDGTQWKIFSMLWQDKK